MTPAYCFICGGDDFGKATDAYWKCLSCGHETLAEGNRQTFMLNDPLDEKDVARFAWIDQFKRTVLEKFDSAPPTGALWVDLGSASGKYLFQNRQRYAEAIGIEVTPSAIEFSRRALGLVILEDVDRLFQPPHILTAWHSLEHFPTDALIHALGTLSERLSSGKRFIVSVPNSDSYQYRWFRRDYAFFDVPNHLHQFSLTSLDRLMKTYGFSRLELVTSWPYNIFGYIQSLLNIATRTHNYLYLRLKRKSPRSSLTQDVLNALLLPLAMPLGWLLGLVDAIRPERQGVITACYEKRP